MTTVASPRLTLAVAHYDRHVPLIDGTVVPEGIALDVKDVGQTVPGRDGTARHPRMLRDEEFDAAEVSLSSYLMARDRGAALTAIPIVPRRLFCQSLFFVRADSPLRRAEELVGKRVGLSAYQVTLSVLAKGDLAHHHGVPWKEIRWVTNANEIVPFDVPAGVSVERAPDGQTVDQMLLSGDLDAAILPHPPSSLIANPDAVRRLFADPRAEEERYYRERGYWPVMHLIAIKQGVADQYPDVPRALYDAFEKAKDMAVWHYEDPNWSVMPWGRQYLESDTARLGGEMWPNGVAKNRVSIERFMGYSHEQGLISAPLTMEQLFHTSLLDT